jgi:Aerotolerance regulator N-terminal/von Willebrand factor type A domain
MAFLYPAFLIGALAIAIPIVLHLLRRDVAPEVPFTAVRLLHRSPVERADRRRLRDLLLLAARIAALLLLAAAFARPYVQGATPAPVRVVAVDRSYSMGAPGIFASALRLARQSIDDAASGERVAVVAFDDGAEVLAAPGSKADARAALEGLAAGFGGTRYGPVVQQAVDLAAGAAGRLVIITDLQRAGWDEESSSTLPTGWSLTARDVMQDAASPRSNLAVTAVTIDGGRVLAAIRNDGPLARAGTVRVVSDGQSVATTDYAVPPGAAIEAPITWRVPESGAFTVTIDDSEGLPADNARFVALGSRAAATALIVVGPGTGELSTARKPSALYLSRALGTSSGEDAEVVSGSQVAALSLERLSSYGGVALLTTRGLERPARDLLMSYVNGGGGLFIAAASDIEASILAEMTAWQPSLTAVEQGGPLTLAATDLRHPILRPFGALAANLGQVRVDRSWRVSPDGWSVIARFSNGTPALLERMSGRGRVVLFASDVNRRWNDFPLHPAFVPFAIEAMRYVGGDRRQPREYTVAQAPALARHVPGVYRGLDNRPFSVNVDAREGALESMTPGDFEGRVERSGAGASRAVERQARQTESSQSYWQYGLALMIATLIAESVVGRA